MRQVASRAGRYLVVGAVSNLALFASYVILTALAMPAVAASTLVFGGGIAITYLVNRGWSFQSSARHRTALPCYLLSYAAGYGCQIAVLVTATNWIGLPHQLAQFFGMAAAACIIFAMLNYTVFPANRERTTRALSVMKSE